MLIERHVLLQNDDRQLKGSRTLQEQGRGLLQESAWPAPCAGDFAAPPSDRMERQVTSC